MAEGGGCRDERRGSSASEVGTDDGTAATTTTKSLPVCLHASLSSKHKDLPVTTTISIAVHRCTRFDPTLPVNYIFIPINL